MKAERWDVPSEKLRRVAEQKNTPNMRLCSCKHFHPEGERCGHYTESGLCSCKR